MREDVEKLTTGADEVGKQTVLAIDTLLTSRGCSSYIKTIYVGYVLQGEMVAAVYPEHVGAQIALALPEDCEGTDLVDATHLTWPTMPLALEVRTAEQIPRAVALASVAVDRVESGLHDVVRPAEFFRNRDRRGGRRH